VLYTQRTRITSLLTFSPQGKALLLPEDVQHRAMTAIQDDVFAAAIKSAISPQIINTYGAPPMLPTVNVVGPIIKKCA
jgi:hypothetical protein